MKIFKNDSDLFPVGIVTGIILLTGVITIIAVLLTLHMGEDQESTQEEEDRTAIRDELEEPENNGGEGDNNEEDKPEWERPRTEERKEERIAMVEEQIEGRGVESRKVIDAMRHVPRHLFVPEEHRRRAYDDRPLPIPHGQTISQPYIVAFMSEQLNLTPGDRVLEIGTGSGYHAAVLAELTPEVFTIEIIEELAGWGEKNLQNTGYDTVSVKAGDGYFGWEEHAPFDGIIVTAAAGHVPPPLMEQLRPGGRMIIPVGSPYETQYMVLVEKDEDGEVSSEHLMPVRFVPMTGEALEADE